MTKRTKKLPEEFLEQDTWDAIEEQIFVPFEYSQQDRGYYPSELYTESQDDVAFYPRSRKFTYFAVKLDDKIDLEKHNVERVFKSDYLELYEFRKAKKPMALVAVALKGFKRTEVSPEMVTCLSRETLSDKDQHLFDIYQNRSIRVYGRKSRGVKVPDIIIVAKWEW